MSILETNKVDIIATRPGSSTVKLVITDHLEWGDFDTHAGMLQAKINTYLEFIESGQLKRAMPPNMQNETVSIVVALQHSPSAAAEKFLEDVRVFLANSGVHFEIDVTLVQKSQ